MPAVEGQSIFPIDIETIRRVDKELTGSRLALVPAEEQEIMRGINPFLYGNINATSRAIYDAAPNKSIGDKVGREYLFGAVVNHRVCRLEAERRGFELPTVPQDIATDTYSRLLSEDENKADLDTINEVREYMRELQATPEQVLRRMDEIKRVAQLYRRNNLAVAKAIQADNSELDLYIIMYRLSETEMQGFVTAYSAYQLYYNGKIPGL